MDTTRCSLNFALTLLIFSFVAKFPRATKIIDYDNVEQNPYYRKSNLDLIIRRHCQFLQPKTSSTAAPAPSRGKFSDRLSEALGGMGTPLKNKDELPDRLIDGLVGFIRGAHKDHELNNRNLTAEERVRLQELLPELIKNLENEEDGDVYDA